MAAGNDNTPASTMTSIPVVGLGASAGGLDALERFFKAMPDHSGLAFVVVQHLDPSQPSVMPEILAKATGMPVQAVTGDVSVEPDHVYVMAPNSFLTIVGGVLKPHAPTEPRGHRTPIDSFFRSLAEDREEDAVCIVLSGSGSDGTLGIRAIKELGGMAMAQSSDSARYDAMPRSAVAQGLVDFVLPVEDMPGQLMKYFEYRRTMLSRHPSEAEPEDGGATIRRICGLLHRRTGHDFSHYKQPTLLRRIQRRMQVLHVDSHADYLERLRRDSAEAGHLFKDLLISVTQFFRDTSAFDALARLVIPRILDNRAPDDQVRVWVPGCATGEEAYSIAMLIEEHSTVHHPGRRVQIFATDIDDDALEIARQGRYSEELTESLSPERLERFFIHQGSSYVVTRDLREKCIFSSHNLVSDPPFSRLDLLSCRNLLIYLEASLLRTLAPLFHYALKPGGFLLLGPSEHVALPELFRVVDKKNRIFQRRDVVIQPAVSFPLTDPVRAARLTANIPPMPGAARDQAFTRSFDRILLDNYAPAAAVINERAEILYTSGRTGRYLELPPGATTVNIVQMSRAGLRLHVQAAIHNARKTRQAVSYDNLSVELDDRVQRVNLIVRPMSEFGEDADLMLVVFQEVGRLMSQEQAEAEGTGRKIEDPIARQLEAELRSTREHLQSTIEELETSNEELKSSNEELLSMNEELQSANEEHQTSKEELHSANEELETVNAELRRKYGDLDRANSDLQNLLLSTQIATIFLDNDLRIKRFTPEATSVFRLLESDVGRPITDFAPRFDDGNIVTDIQQVLRTLGSRSRQVRLVNEEAWFMMRVLPYRTVDNIIEGVVITFADISELKRAEAERARIQEELRQAYAQLEIRVDERTAQLTESHSSLASEVKERREVEEALRTSEERFRQLSDSGVISIAFFHLDGKIIEANDAFLKQVGYPQSALAEGNLKWDQLLPPENREKFSATLASLGQTGQITPCEMDFRRADGTTFWGLFGAAALRGGQEGVAFLLDVTERKEAAEALREADRRKDEFLAMLGHELRNPLAPVRSAAYLLQRLGSTDEKQVRARLIIERQVKHLTRMVDDLLDVSRLSRGKILLKKERLDLSDVVCSVLEDNADGFRERGLTIELHAPETPIWVDGDATRLAQVTGNLLNNSLKFTDPGGHVTVTLETRLEDRQAVLTVRDTGIGMSAELVRRVFEPFVQADGGLARSRGGLGLGLGLVKGLVEMHGGVASVKSDGPGKGTECTVQLPLADGPGVLAAGNGHRASTRNPRRILLVEDNVDSAESLKLLLQVHGHKVEAAYEGTSGLEKANQLEPEVVLCDIGLPGAVNGYDVARAIRANERLRSSYLVALSGYGQEHDQRRALEAGFDLHLTKPVDPDFLAGLLAGPLPCD